MSGEVNADLNTIPILNLIIIFVGIILVILVIALVIKKFGLQVSKGTIKASDYHYDQDCQTIMYHLQETIETIDYETRCAMRRQTKPCNYRIAQIGDIQNMCHASRRSLFYALKEPFYDYINNNHFTREFLPDNFEPYRTSLIEYIRETYQELLLEYNFDECSNDTMQEWSEVEDDMEHFIDSWLVMIMTNVKRACARKIEEYQKVLPMVEKSTHWNAVLTGCIDKNNKYIESIRELINNQVKRRRIDDEERDSVLV